jgi:N-sulfoglucosamine sulfohydrolase
MFSRVLALAPVVALLGPALAPSSRASVVPPNVLVVMADDWGPHAGAYGTRWIRTPSFDRVAREGLLFRRAYTPLAKCAPSRATVLTGRHPWLNGAAANHSPFFPPELKTWPEALGERGWHVGSTGKTWAPGIAVDAAGKPRALAGKAYSARTLTPPTRAISNNDYSGNFAAFLDAAPPGKPWAFWLGTQEPHRSYEYLSGATKGGKTPADIDRVPAYWPDTEVVRHDMLDYAFAAENVDLHLGRALAELERRGLLDSTLVIVTSDHGMPFPRVKGYAYHASNHVPLAIRWPAGLRRPGRVIDDHVDFADLAPTILDFAGVAAADTGMRPFSGRSLRPILESEREGRIVPERDHTLVGKERTDVGRPGDAGYPIRGLLTDGFLFLRNSEPSRWPAGNPETGYLDTDGSPTKTLILEMGRRDRRDPFWLLNFGFRPAEELYDLASDPDCVRNLAADPAHAARLRSLRDRMDRELLRQGDPRAEGRGAEFERHPPANNANFHERYLRGESVNSGWVTPTDFEPAPINPESLR